MKRYLIGLMVLLGMLSACKKKNKDEDPAINYERDLSPEGVIFWDSQETITLRAHDIVMPNGKRLDDPSIQIAGSQGISVNGITDPTLGPQAARAQLIRNLMEAALYFTDRDKFVYNNEGPNKPAQHGLAYSWGQRNFKVRAKPPGDGNKCQEEVYGLDCSGLFYNLFKRSGITVSSGNAESQRETEGIRKAILNSYPNLTKIKVESLGKIPAAAMQTGDIIYWLEKGVAKHIGLLALDGTNRLSIAQSNGNEADNCEQNYTAKRGPRFSPIAKAILPKPTGPNQPGGYGDDYRVLRINGEISGKWAFSIKCAGASAFLFNLNLDFPVNIGNSFTATTTAKDYDGSTNTFKFNFTYDNVQNTLSCEYTMTDSQIATFERKDSFVADLDLGDDTGLIAAKNVYIRNGGGCSEEVRLVNAESLKSNITGNNTIMVNQSSSTLLGTGYLNK